MGRIPYMTQINFMCTDPPTDQQMKFMKEFDNNVICEYFDIINDLPADDLSDANYVIDKLKEYVNEYTEIIKNDDSMSLLLWIDKVYTIKFIDGKFYYEQGLEEMEPLKQGLKELKNSFINDNIDTIDILLIMLNVTVKGKVASVINFPYYHEEV